MRKTTFVLLIILNAASSAQWIRQSDYISAYNFGRALYACDDSTAVFFGASGNGEGIYLTLDAGQSWNPRIIPENFATDVCVSDKNYIWYSTQSGNIYNSTNKGVDWSKQFSIGKEIAYLKMFDRFNGIMIPNAGDTTAELTVYVTASSGTGWSPKTAHNIGGNLSDWRRADFLNNKTGFYYDAGKTQKLYKTLDGCNSWSATNYSGYANLIKFFDENTGLAVSVNWDVRQYVIQKTTDGGLNWKTVNTEIFGAWPSDLEFIPGSPDKIWFAADNNLFYSEDGALSWTKYSIDNGAAYCRDIHFVDKFNGWLLCDGGKVYHTNNNGGFTTDIQPVSRNSIPSFYFLSQNYPNPFNPETTIKFSVPAVVGNANFAFPTRISLKVYDVLGREIATLVDEYKSPGIYEIKFNGSSLPSGVYIYRLVSGNYTRSHKMIMTK